MSNTIGIDFGTTKTLVAYINPQTGLPTAANLGRGSAYLPTTVYAESPDNMLFGDEADDNMMEDPTRYCRGFKMRLGEDFPVLFVRQDGKAYTAKALTTAFLRYVRERCEEEVLAFRGKSITKAVITCPVHFSLAQEEALKEAAYAAGFHEVELASEPVAAAHAYCAFCPQDAFTGNALIVDWGGGTLDFALVSRSADGGQVTVDPDRTEGSDNMGGELFDFRLLEHARKQIRARDGVDIKNSADMLKTVRRYKELLSSKEKVDMRLSHGAGLSKLTVTRPEFEGLIARELDLATTLARRLVDAIPHAEDKPKLMLLVGGTSGIPSIKSVLEKTFSMPCHKWEHSRNSVAFGAALLAAGGETAPRQAVEPAQPAAPEPQEIAETALAVQDFFTPAMQFFDSCNPEDWPKAAAGFAQGHERGDLNCTAMLTECYFSGKGVGKDMDTVALLANYMVEQRFAAGYAHLAAIYEGGMGVPMDASRARDYRVEVLRLCANPVAGMHEMVRYRCLLSVCYFPELQGTMPRYAREYFEVSPYSDKYDFLAAALAETAMDTESGKSELRKVLDAGCTENCALCMYMKSLLIAGESDMYPDSPSLARSLGLKAAKSGIPMTLLSSLRYFDSNEKARKQAGRFWKSCRMGQSMMLAPNALDVEIGVQDGFSAFMRVYELSVAQRYLEAERYGEIVSPCVADMNITNKERKTLRNVSVHICCPKAKAEHSFTIEALKQGETYVFDPNLEGLDLQDLVVVDVSCGGRRSVSDINTAEGYETFNPNIPSLIIVWRKGFFGGFVLQLLCLEGRLDNVVVHRIGSDGHSNPVSIQEGGGFAEIGWNEMSDGAGMKENEFFTVTADGYAPLVASIRTSENDSSSSGWKSVAKWIGAGAAIALGAS